MKLTEAIEIATHYDANAIVPQNKRYLEAVKRLIKAGKRELIFRERVPKKEWSLLPGETEE